MHIPRGTVERIEIVIKVDKLIYYNVFLFATARSRAGGIEVMLGDDCLNPNLASSLTFHRTVDQIVSMAFELRSLSLTDVLMPMNERILGMCCGAWITPPYPKFQNI